MGQQLRPAWRSDNQAKAEVTLAELVDSYRESEPDLAIWLNEIVRSETA